MGIRKMIGALFIEHFLHILDHNNAVVAHGAADRSLSPNRANPRSLSKSEFTYMELEKATEHFSERNLLGKGGFGSVYRGMLRHGEVVAIKRFEAQNQVTEASFEAEADIIGRVHHRHLIHLIGYCTTPTEYLLVYEYAHNNSVEFHLHGSSENVLSWPTRYKIALGSAKGLAYLHEECEPKIIHRDLKPDNILLDLSFEAKVADFGISKFFPDDRTHITTRPIGTFGYFAPEYITTGHLSEKSDAYSYGVVLLELITGQKPSYQRYHPLGLVAWAYPRLKGWVQETNEHLHAIVDPRLKGNFNKDEMICMCAIADRCLSEDPSKRPTMHRVVEALTRLNTSSASTSNLCN